MRFPIDVVFLSEEDVVLKVVHRLPPWRAAGMKGARSMLELAAGEVESRGIDVGSTLRYDPPARDQVTLREAAQTLSEYVVVLVVISATIMAALVFMSGVVARLMISRLRSSPARSSSSPLNISVGLADTSR